MSKKASTSNFQIEVQLAEQTFLLDSRPVSGVRTEPLGYEELVQYANERKPIPLTLHNMEVISGPCEVVGSEITASVSFAPKHYAGIFVLVEGGWTLPGPWVDADLLMLDRNVVIDLEATPKNEEAPFSTKETYWADLFKTCSSECHLLTFGIEGRECKKPQLKAFLEETARAYRALTRWFPLSQLSELDNARLTGGIGLANDFERFYLKAAIFLESVIPLLARQIRAQDRESIYSQILLAADHAQLEHSDIIVLLAISCLYEVAGGKYFKKPINPGRAILKPNEPNFYNSAFDVWLLELLVGGNTFPDKRIALATKDKGLAALWSLLEPRRFRMAGELPAATVTLNEHMFPAMKRNQLERLASDLS